MLWSGNFPVGSGAILSFGFSTYAHFEVTVAILPDFLQRCYPLLGKASGPIASHGSIVDFTKSA